MSIPAQRAADGIDLTALEAITDAVESGAGLPEVIRAAARALDASLVLIDRAGTVLAAAARPPADGWRRPAGAPPGTGGRGGGGGGASGPPPGAAGTSRSERCGCGRGRT